MIRELVRRLQFTDDTTIDGNRLDGLMQAFVDRFNALTPRDIERNWTETVFVSGYQPVKTGGALSNPILPWINPRNPPTTAPIYPAVDESLFYPTNEYRSKGWGLPYLTTNIGLGGGNYYQWSSSFHVFKPTIITKLMFVMRTDDEFTNTFVYGANPPPGKSDGDSCDDFTIELAVDNPFTQENRSQSNTEVLRTRFPAAAWTMSTDIAGGNDMQPAYPNTDGTGNVRGVYVNLDVEVPVPQNARVRLNLVIPQYSGGVYDAGWGDEDSFAKQYYSVAVSMLEKA